MSSTTYFLILEAETGDPAIQNVLDSLCSGKDEFEGAMSWSAEDWKKWKVEAAYWDEGFEKYVNTTIRDLFPGIVCVERAERFDDFRALARLAGKLVDLDYREETSWAHKIRERNTTKDTSRYLFCLEAMDVEDSQIQSLMDYFCGLKEHETEYFNSKVFEEEYTKFVNATVRDIFWQGNECGVKNGQDSNGRSALNQLAAKLAECVRQSHYRFVPLEQEPPEIQRIYAM